MKGGTPRKKCRSQGCRLYPWSRTQELFMYTYLVVVLIKYRLLCSLMIKVRAFSFWTMHHQYYYKSEHDHFSSARIIFSDGSIVVITELPTITIFCSSLCLYSENYDKSAFPVIVPYVAVPTLYHTACMLVFWEYTQAVACSYFVVRLVSSLKH